MKFIYMQVRIMRIVKSVATLSEMTVRELALHFSATPPSPG